MNFANRSLFFSLELAGAGTGQVESLRSYVQRLALAHCLNPKHLFDLLEQRFPFDACKSQSIHVLKNWDIQNHSPRGLAFLERLEAATTVPLGQSSLARFGSVVGPSDLLRKNWVYCPHCLAAGERYSRLLWDVHAVQACPVHQVRLVEVVCGAPEELYLTVPQRVSSACDCSHCGAAGFTCNQVSPLPATEQEIWEANMVGSMLAIPTEERLTTERMLTGLRAVVTAFFDGKPVRAALDSGIARANVHYWLQWKFVPSLPGLLAICSRSGADLAALLKGEFVQVREPRPVATAVQPKRLYRKAVFSHDVVRESLLNEAQRPMPRSVAALAVLHGTNHKRLRSLFPEEVDALVAARKGATKAKQEGAFESAVATYSSAVRQLAEFGESINVKTVQKAAGLVAHSLNPVRVRALESAMQQGSFVPQQGAGTNGAQEQFGVFS